jgi:hypothetical protein
MGYGIKFTEASRQVGAHVGRILNGTKPADDVGRFTSAIVLRFILRSFDCGRYVLPVMRRRVHHIDLDDNICGCFCPGIERMNGTKTPAKIDNAMVSSSLPPTDV